MINCYKIGPITWFHCYFWISAIWTCYWYISSYLNTVVKLTHSSDSNGMFHVIVQLQAICTYIFLYAFGVFDGIDLSGRFTVHGKGNVMNLLIFRIEQACKWAWTWCKLGARVCVCACASDAEKDEKRERQRQQCFLFKWTQQYMRMREVLAR